MTESSKGVSVLYGSLRLSLTDPPPPSPFSLPTNKKRTLKVLCRSCSLVFQMVNHRSQIHLAQTGDDDRSQTWVWDENSLILIRIKWNWKHHFFLHLTCSSADLEEDTDTDGSTDFRSAFFWYFERPILSLSNGVKPALRGGGENKWIV